MFPENPGKCRIIGRPLAEFLSLCRIYFGRNSKWKSSQSLFFGIAEKGGGRTRTNFIIECAPNSPFHLNYFAYLQNWANIPTSKIFFSKQPLSVLCDIPSTYIWIFHAHWSTPSTYLILFLYFNFIKSVRLQCKIQYISLFEFIIYLFIYCHLGSL